MRPNPLFASEDPDLVRELVREHPESERLVPTWNFTVAHQTRRSTIAALHEEGPYRQPALADEMERELRSRE